MAGVDRARGVLTKDDRKYLIGQKDFGPDTERNTRKRIRDRTRNALYDFEYLISEFEDRDVTQLATDEGDADEEIFEAAENVIAFVFRLCRLAPETEVYTTENRFREVLRNGIERGIANEHKVLDFKLDLNYGLPQKAQGQIQEKLHFGKPLTLAELREAVNNDYLDDSYSFEPVGKHGLPEYVDIEDTLTEDDYR